MADRLTDKDVEDFIEEVGCNPGCECGECSFSDAERVAWLEFLVLVAEGRATEKDWPAFG